MLKQEKKGNAVLGMCMKDLLEALGAWGPGPGSTALGAVKSSIKVPYPQLF